MMEHTYSYKDFLLDLDKSKNKTIYARITALTFNELPIETIEGRVTQGSINVDGASAVRRSCSLTLVAQDFQYNNYYWGLNTKFKLEIGVENKINNAFPDIIWFKQGVYILTNFSTSRSTSNFTISLQGKDKMCLINGEVGGSFESSIDFGCIEEKDENGVWTIRKIPIPEIIRNAVHVYAGEPYHNIIINDLDTYGLELLEYRYDIPMYLYRPCTIDNEGHVIASAIYDNAILESDNIELYKDPEDEKSKVYLKDIENEYLDKLVDDMVGVSEPKPLYQNGKPYIFAKIEYGQTAGYRSTDLVYAGDLIANIGESLTSVLDKIKNMLVEFEYFYNLDGQFVFQKKQSFVSTMWSPLSVVNGNVKMEESLAIASSHAYQFSGGELITAFNNNPNLLNLKNDYSIWGQRDSISGEKIPVHMRYAIDLKPMSYTTVAVSDEDVKDYNEKYNTTLKGQESTTYDISAWDWREVLYRMAEDYYKYNHLDDFELRLIKANGSLYPSGRTGYETYYTDIQGFWRQLYNPSPEEKDRENYYESGDNKYWNKNVYEAPQLLNFWIDFLDSGDIAKYNVKNIGSRSKSINDSNVKSIYFRETPDIIFVDQINDEDILTGYRYIQIGAGRNNMFSISAQGKSAKDRLDELLYQHSYCIESATITSIPIYYLEPNTRIYLEDNDTSLFGDYIVSKITIPLSYNGTMSITATKAAENII